MQREESSSTSYASSSKRRSSNPTPEQEPSTTFSSHRASVSSQESHGSKLNHEVSRSHSNSISHSRPSHPVLIELTGGSHPQVATDKESPHSIQASPLHRKTPRRNSGSANESASGGSMSREKEAVAERDESSISSVSKNFPPTDVDATVPDIQYISKEDKRIRRLQESWFGATYFLVGWTSALRPLLSVYLRDNGVSNFLIGVVQAMDSASIVFKIPMGLLSDSVNLCGLGNRRPYILIGMVGAALMYGGIAVVEVTEFNYGAFLALYLGVSMLREVFDKPFDAYIIETTPISDAGRVQGTIKNGSRAIGLIPSLLLTGLLSDGYESGWTIVFFVVTALSLLPSLWTCWVPEPSATSHFQWGSLAELKRPNVMAHAAWAFLSAIPGNILNVIVPLFLESRGFSNTDIAVVLGLGAIILLIGAVTTGVLIDRYRHTFVKLFVLNEALAICAIVIFVGTAASSSIEVIYLWAVVTGFTFGAGLALNQALIFLEIQDPAISASFVALFSTVSALGQFIGSFISGAILEEVGYANTGAIVVVISCVRLPCLIAMFRGQDYATKAAKVVVENFEEEEEDDDIVEDIELDILNETEATGKLKTGPEIEMSSRSNSLPDAK